MPLSAEMSPTFRPRTSSLRIRMMRSKAGFKNTILPSPSRIVNASWQFSKSPRRSWFSSFRSLISWSNCSIESVIRCVRRSFVPLGLPSGMVPGQPGRSVEGTYRSIIRKLPARVHLSDAVPLYFTHGTCYH